MEKTQKILVLIAVDLKSGTRESFVVAPMGYVASELDVKRLCADVMPM